MQQMNEWLDEVISKFYLEEVEEADLLFVQKVISQYSLGGPEWCAGEFLCSREN